MGMAKLVEDKCNAAKLRPIPPQFPQTTPTSLPQNQSNNWPPPLPIKRLSPSEMVARQEKGLYFKCEAPFTPGHRCQPPQFLCLIAGDEKEAPPDAH